ncbi:ubiquitin-protein ligase E3 [Schizosaccharomyces octosporus yFS286]|uniref:HECT-type E3 ubiquitin transferase n=1 Tax=Schizosaccharomyces octosporus (strain yFS286) TaxID=483514 RepID=S9Q062_SCHOY|nr:ubiquitin-protein ligase E3 [Schizosaccharomyces octosporus yFS286]EPX73088.1 ubiquitin-protein ligase E3 [Schizosaccharomyces octosporus yFS286]
MVSQLDFTTQADLLSLYKPASDPFSFTNLSDSTKKHYLSGLETSIKKTKIRILSDVEKMSVSMLPSQSIHTQDLMSSGLNYNNKVDSGRSGNYFYSKSRNQLQNLSPLRPTYGKKMSKHSESQGLSSASKGYLKDFALKSSLEVPSLIMHSTPSENKLSGARFANTVYSSNTSNGQGNSSEINSRNNRDLSGTSRDYDDQSDGNYYEESGAPYENSNEDDYDYDENSDSSTNDTNNNDDNYDDQESNNDNGDEGHDDSDEDEEDDEDKEEEEEEEEEKDEDDYSFRNVAFRSSDDIFRRRSGRNFRDEIGDNFDEQSLFSELNRLQRSDRFRRLASSVLSSGNLENADDDDLGASDFPFNPLRPSVFAPSGQFSRLLRGIKDFSDPTIQLLSLQELSETLAMSTEDMLIGVFSPDAFIAAFSDILSSEILIGETAIQLMLTCATCISNMMEALPISMVKVAHSPIVRILCERMFDMQYIDIAEQALGIFEKLSVDFGNCILQHRGMLAALQYFDFFYTNVQRTAISLSANCCKHIDEFNVEFAEEIIPLLSNTLQSSDPVVVMKGFECLESIIESLNFSPNIIKSLINEDLISIVTKALNASTMQKKATDLQVQLFHIIASLCKSSSSFILPVLNQGLPEIMYELLCGIPPPETSHHSSMVAMQSLYHCPNNLITALLRTIISFIPKAPFAGQEDLISRIHRMDSILLPIVLDIYSTVPTHEVKLLAVSTALMMLRSISGEDLRCLVRSLPLSSFIASILSARKADNHSKQNALEMAIYLHEALPDIYHSLFIREGVVQEVGYINRSINSDLKKLKLSISFSQSKSTHRHEELKKLSSIKALSKSFLGHYEIESLENPVLHDLVDLSKRLANDVYVGSSCEELAVVFQKTSNITSFELLHSGLIRSLLLSLRKSDNNTLRYFLLSMNKSKETEVLEYEGSPLMSFIFCLQELLSRIENFQLTLLPSLSDNSLEHVSSKQFKVRLIALPGSNIQPPFRSLIVSINGLATIRVLDNYLYSRVLHRGENERRRLSFPEADSLQESGDSTRHESFENSMDLSQNENTSAGSGSVNEADSSVSGELGSRHFAFCLGKKLLTPETTIFKALFHFIETSDEHTIDDIWKTTIPLYYGEPSSYKEDNEAQKSVDESEEIPNKIKEILEILRVLYYGVRDLHTIFPEKHIRGSLENVLMDFSNWKLSAKLNRQLEEQPIIVHGCIPSWCISLTSEYPFLIPFESRYQLLQSTSLGLARSVSFILSRNSNLPKNEGSSILQYVSLRRQKIRIPRKDMFNYALQVLSSYGSSDKVLEIEYEDEVGSGLGPTLEFYTTVSREFTNTALDIWRNEQGDSQYVFHASGLFPSPISMAEGSDESKRKLSLFSALGKFVARSIYDSRIVSLQCNPLFFARAIPLTISSVAKVDKGLANSLRYLESLISGEDGHINDIDIESLGLDFTLPGYSSIELIPNGSTVSVNKSNLKDYIEHIIDFTVGKGVRRQIECFQEGFSSVFAYSSLKVLTEYELSSLFGTIDEDWSYETLLKFVVADHGYTIESAPIQRLLQLMSSMNFREQRDFLQFITGSRKLPIGGFAGMNPPFTIVRRLNEPPYKPDDYLPTVMTCVNYLKLPEYSSVDVLASRLSKAILEGQGSFHLS